MQITGGLNMKSSRAKRMLSFILALIVLFSAVPSVAHAGGGSYVAIVNIAELASEATTAAVLYNNGSVGSAYNGASYDKATNTLTLSGFNNTEQFLEINNMGSDFTIKVENQNSIGIIEVFLGPLTITGSGSLSVNPDGTATMYYGYYSGITLQAESANAYLSVENGPTLSVKGYDGKDAITVTGTTNSTGISVAGRVDAGSIKSNRFPESRSFVIQGYDSPMYLDLYQSNGEYYGVYTFTLYSSGVSSTKYQIWHLTGDYENLTVDNDTQMVQKESLAEYTQIDGLFYAHYLTNTNGFAKIVPSESSDLVRPTVTTSSLPNATVGSSYSATLTGSPANGGTITTFSIVDGDLPSGLSLDQDTGVISGTPTETGTFNISVVTHEYANGTTIQSLSKTLPLKVAKASSSFVFSEAVTDGFRHNLIIKNSSDQEVKDLWLDDIAANYTIDISDFAAGNYTATFTGRGDGVIVSYANGSTYAFTLSGSQSNTISFDPGAPTVTVEPSTVIVNIENYDTIKDYHPLVEVTVGGNVAAIYNAEEHTVIYDILDNASQPYSVRLITYTSLNYEIANLTESVSYSCQTATVTGTASGYQIYKGSVPDYCGHAFLKCGDSGIYLYDKAEYILTSEAAAALTFGNAYLNDIGKQKYDAASGAVSISGNTISVSFTQLHESAALTGTVKDNSGKAIQGASITVTQTFNEANKTVTAVTDANGNYSVSGLINEKTATVTCTKSGYTSSTVTNQAIGGTANFTLTGQGKIDVHVDGYLTYPTLIWSGSGEAGRLDFEGGSDFSVPVSADLTGNVSITLNADNLASPATTTAAVKNGVAAITLAPVYYGLIDWSGMDAEGNLKNDYSGFYLRIINGGSVVYRGKPGAITSYKFAPGDYTVELATSYDGAAAASQEISVKSSETSYVTIDAGAGLEGTSITLTAPDSAAAGEIYTINGLIESLPVSSIRDITFTAYGGADITPVNNIVIGNGAYSYVHSGAGNPVVIREDESTVSWELPLRFTVYCKQETAGGGIQTIAASYTDNEGQSHYMGTVATACKPGISIDVPDKVGSINKNGTLIPGNFSFYGKALAGTVYIYDNEELCAVVEANTKGVFEGTATLISTEATHVIKAVVLDGTGKPQYTATDVCTYDPIGPILKTLTLNGSEVKPGKTLSYVATPTMVVNVRASFENADRLAEITAEVDGVETKGKVFFHMMSAGGVGRTIKATESGNGIWEASYQPGTYYPVGIDAIYRCVEADETTTVTVKDETGADVDIDVDYWFGADFIGGDPNSTVYDYSGLLNGIINDYNTANPGKPVTSSGAIANNTKNIINSNTRRLMGSLNSLALLGNNDESNEEITGFDAVVWALNGPGGAEERGEKASVLTPSEAVKPGAEGVSTVRTYTDQPAWGNGAEEIKQRTAWLKELGYTSASYTDPNTNQPILIFTGTFYYAKDGVPVPQLYVTNNYNGILKTEEDSRMFNNGKPLGSTLEVTYMYSYAEHRWIRTQTATIPPGAMSPIHVSSTQVPSAKQALIRYTSQRGDVVSPVGSVDTAAGVPTTRRLSGSVEMPENPMLLGALSTTLRAAGSGTGGTLLGKGSGSLVTYETRWYEYQGGVQFTVPWKWDKVSLKTYTGYGISIGNAVASTTVQSKTAIKGLSKYVDSKTGKAVSGMLAQYLLKARPQNIKVKGVSGESLLIAGITKLAGDANNRYVAEVPISEITGDQRNEFNRNMQYWGKVKTACANSDDNNGVNDFHATEAMANEMIRRTANMEAALTALEAKIEGCRTQDQWNGEYTDGVSNLSLIVSLVPDYGTAGSLMLDSYTFALNGINDCRKAEVAKALEDYIKARDEYLDYDYECKRVIIQDEEWREQYKKDNPSMVTKTMSELCGTDLKNDPMGHVRLERGKQVDYKSDPNHDPSGIVYEGVLSNPVQGATVTLYKYTGTGGADDTRTIWDDSDGLGQANPLTSDEDGYYRWDVPTGEWYVTADKAGYVSGSSQNDTAAAITHGTTNYLPVLPPQLNVNIPIVSYEAPAVESVRATTDGIYVTFTKYMDEASLTASAFIVDGSPASGVQLLDSEAAPANINYGGTAPKYTKTILVESASGLTTGDQVSFNITGILKSYANVGMASSYATSAAVKTQEALADPVFSVVGEVASGTVVTVTQADGADIYYTTGSSDFSKSTWTKLGSGSGDIVITARQTIRAIAVKTSYPDSAIVSASYTIKPSATGQQPTPPSGGSGSGGTAVKPVETKAEPSEKFTDVNKEAFYYDALAWALENNITEGMTDSTFGPQLPCTRAQVVTFLWRAAGCPEPDAFGTNYTDVAAGSYYEKAVRWAAQQGITLGTAEGVFSPNLPCSRAQVVTFLYRYEHADGSGLKTVFYDIEDEAYFRDSVAWASENGITNGIGDKLFGPFSICSRAQIITFLYRDFVK